MEWSGMRFSNKYTLPDAYVRAVENDPYDNQGSDFTPSSLAQPPLAYALKKAFGDDIVVDVSTRVDAIIGQGTHFVAERAARPGVDLCEERLFMTLVVDGTEYKISAAIDLYETDTGHLMDWKTTKAYAFSKKSGGGKKPDWISQTNIGAELLRRRSYEPKKLSIIALLKDWSMKDKGTPGCPEQQVIEVEIPIWSSDKVISYIEERIRLLVSATVETVCTESWGGKRCAQWCDVNSVCPTYKKQSSTGIL